MGFFFIVVVIHDHRMNDGHFTTGIGVLVMFLLFVTRDAQITFIMTIILYSKNIFKKNRFTVILLSFRHRSKKKSLYTFTVVTRSYTLYTCFRLNT